ncbi:MAG: helix-turn-helix domain-containing protein [Clostridia bacterium]|nr:helix-turn-helix domain-containing protein [Clostridia bacterium]
MSNVKIGNKISEVRKKRGLSIREFSKKVDLSASLLSQIERGMANPSLNTLRMIAEGLDMPLYTLFIDEIQHELLILRKSERRRINHRDSEHVVFDLLSPDYMKSNVEMLWAILNPNSETTPTYMSHEKEEFALVMKGEVWVVIDEREYLLEEGDMVRLLPRMKHKFKNTSDETIEILFILAESTL